MTAFQFSFSHYFYILNDWPSNQLSLMQQAPSDERVIKHDLLAAIDQFPLLTPLL